MARRLDITVPTHKVEYLRLCLRQADKCSFNETSERVATIIEVPAGDIAIFYVTIPGDDIGRVLKILNINGVGTDFGAISVSTVDCMLPSFSTIKSARLKRLSDAQRQSMVETNTNHTLGFAQFQTARLTTEEIYNKIVGMAKMDLNVWVQLFASCIITAAGLISDNTVVLVAGMLISPLMGPILALTFGYRIADYALAKVGIINEIIMAATAYGTGCIIGLVIGPVGPSLGWPTEEMLLRGSLNNYAISPLVSASAGAALGVSVTAGGVNGMIGVALSASLLPPIINSGILTTYAAIYSTVEEFPALRLSAGISMALYLTSCVIIFFTTNLMFYLKVWKRE